MKYFKNLKTSERITTYFSLFNLFSLIFLLISINIIYFVLWYNDIEKKSLYELDNNYKNSNLIETSDYLQSFKSSIFNKDIIITSDNGKMTCSPGATIKLDDSDEEAQKAIDSLFYKKDGKIYIVFSKKYPGIGRVSVLNDTTDYFNSQLLITKISLIIILFFIIINYFVGKYFSKIALSDLKNISKKAGEFDLDCDFKNINIAGPRDDEIKILASVLNKSFKKIKNQSEIQKQFIDDVSHEFKTPIMIISSKIDLYEKYLEKGKQINNLDFINSLKTNLKKLNRIIETLFFLSRIEEKEGNLELKKINLKEFIELKILELKGVYSNKKISYNIEVEKDIEVEKISFGVLLDNILTNAIKFNSNDIKINITFKNNILEIIDNGNGIEKDKLKSIWKKFSRFDNNIEGFGIGLFLVKRIIKIYSWKINVESKIGYGTKFIIKM